MFFKWKKKYEQAIVDMNRVRGINGDLVKVRNKYNDFLRNLELVPKEKNYDFPDIYVFNSNLYYIYEKLIPFSLYNDYEVEYFAYNLTSGFLNPICKLNAEIKITNGVAKVEIVSLDTMDELKCGHASKQLQKLMKLANFIKAERVFGRLYLNTPIGVENLKRFYEKNGFDISGDYSKKLFIQNKQL